MDDDPSQDMGDDTIEVTEEMSDQADAKHMEAREKMSNGMTYRLNNFFSQGSLMPRFHY